MRVSKSSGFAPRTECKIRRNNPLDGFCDFARAGAEGGKPGGTYGVLTSRPGFFAARSGSGEGRRAIAASGDAGVEGVSRRADCLRGRCEEKGSQVLLRQDPDRKSTRLNSSHLGISYAVFCLKKKKKE